VKSGNITREPSSPVKISEFTDRIRAGAEISLLPRSGPAMALNVCTEATVVAVIGLAVNAVSAVLLNESPQREHGDGCAHHHDHNLRPAYLHVLADAAPSAAAILALLL
jgi:hypothetical protein